MTDLEKLVSSVTDDLWRVQKQLIAAFPPGTAEELTLDAGLLSEFKAAVDHSRQLIWSLIEDMSRDSGLRPDEVLLSFRVRRTLEMVHQIRPYLLDPMLLPTREMLLLGNEIKETASELERADRQL
jgi:hypothetical protein